MLSSEDAALTAPCTVSLAVSQDSPSLVSTPFVDTYRVIPGDGAIPLRPASRVEMRSPSVGSNGPIMITWSSTECAAAGWFASTPLVHPMNDVPLCCCPSSTTSYEPLGSQISAYVPATMLLVVTTGIVVTVSSMSSL